MNYFIIFYTYMFLFKPSKCFTNEKINLINYLILLINEFNILKIHYLKLLTFLKYKMDYFN